MKQGKTTKQPKKKQVQNQDAKTIHPIFAKIFDNATKLSGGSK